jgi:hypothetical protein
MNTRAGTRVNEKQIGDGMALTRSSSAFGKLTAELRTVVDDDTKDEFMQLAARDGMSISEYLRDLIMIHVHGRDRLVRLHKARLDRMAGVSTDDGE